MISVVTVDFQDKTVALYGGKPEPVPNNLGSGTLSVAAAKGSTVVGHLYGPTNIGRLPDPKRGVHTFPWPKNLVPGNYKLSVQQVGGEQPQSLTLQITVVQAVPQAPAPAMIRKLFASHKFSGGLPGVVAKYTMTQALDATALGVAGDPSRGIKERIDHAMSIVGVDDIEINDPVVIGTELVNGAYLNRAKRITINNMKVLSNDPIKAACFDAVLINDCDDITINGLTADIVQAYLIFAQNTRKLTVKNFKLTGKTVGEAGVRFITGVDNLTLEDGEIWCKADTNDYAWAKGAAARAMGGGKIWDWWRIIMHGGLAIGPLFGGDAIKEGNYNQVLDSFTLHGCEANGVWLYPGVKNTKYIGGKIDGIKSQYNASGCPIIAIQTRFPPTGPVVRTAPEIDFIGVDFTSQDPQGRLFAGNMPKTVRFIDCTCNGKLYMGPNSAK